MNQSRFNHRDEPRHVSVMCIDNGRTVDALLINYKDDRLIVELPGGMKLTMTKHHSVAGLYMAAHSGMEFQASMKGN